MLHWVHLILLWTDVVVVVPHTGFRRLRAHIRMPGTCFTFLIRGIIVVGLFSFLVCKVIVF